MLGGGGRGVVLNRTSFQVLHAMTPFARRDLIQNPQISCKISDLEVASIPRADRHQAHEAFTRPSSASQPAATFVWGHPLRGFLRSKQNTCKEQQPCSKIVVSCLLTTLYSICFRGAATPR